MTTQVVTRRISWIDQARGMAVLVMVLDHLMMMAGDGWPFAVRMTLGRLAMPAFCVVAGLVMSDRPRLSRIYQVMAGAVVLSIVARSTGLPIGQPDLLWWFAGVFLAARWVRRWPVAFIALGVLQVSAWPVHVLGDGTKWTGYQPGVIVALIACGVVVSQLHPEIYQWRRLQAGWLDVLGQHSLSIYVGHLVVLGGVWWAFI